MDKREMIERALGRFLGEEISTGWEFGLDVLGLSREAIVIECEVEHSGESLDVTKIWGGHSGDIWLDGHHGTPGKALAIIIPLEEEN